MKKFWKNALRLVTLATVIPVNVTHDETTGKTTYQSLLASLEIGTGADGVSRNVGVNLGEGVLSGVVYQWMTARKEAAMYADSELVPSPAKAEDPCASEVEAAPEAEKTPVEDTAEDAQASEGWADLESEF